ncbi:MAG: hypothetical protein ACOYWZ_18020 [Bacillota bacterium]
MLSDLLTEKLDSREISVSLENILQNSKASSGGERDVNFFRFLLDNNLLSREERILKRTVIDFKEEYYEDRYVKMSHESSRHYLCRTTIQDELEKLGINTISSTDVGDMNILRSNSNYDIAASDLSFIMDIGLTPARNFFRGLTDLRVKYYLITTYFDDYMDDIIFALFRRTNDSTFIDAIKDYEDSFKTYTSVALEAQLDNNRNDLQTY